MKPLILTLAERLEVFLGLFSFSYQAGWRVEEKKDSRLAPIYNCVASAAAGAGATGNKN